MDGLKKKLLIVIFALQSVVLIVLLIGHPISWFEERPSGYLEGHLFSIPVLSSEKMDLEEHHRKVEFAARAGESWVKDPLLVAQRFVMPVGKTVAWSFRGGGENTQISEIEVISIVDGFADDSVRGERIDLVLRKDSSEVWSIARAWRSWRCWDWREIFHLDYFRNKRCS
jgi:hypothetical protein